MNWSLLFAPLWITTFLCFYDLILWIELFLNFLCNKVLFIIIITCFSSSMYLGLKLKRSFGRLAWGVMSNTKRILREYKNISLWRISGHPSLSNRRLPRLAPDNAWELWKIWKAKLGLYIEWSLAGLVAGLFHEINGRSFFLINSLFFYKVSLASINK